MSLWIGVLAGLGLTGSVLAEVVAVEVHGGVRERVGVLCEFALPAFKGQTLALKMKDGTRLPLQVDDRGQAMFILPKLAKEGFETNRAKIPRGARICRFSDVLHALRDTRTTKLILRKCPHLPFLLRFTRFETYQDNKIDSQGVPAFDVSLAFYTL